MQELATATALGEHSVASSIAARRRGLLLAALRHMLRRVLPGLGALHTRPGRRLHAGAGAAPASMVHGDGPQAVTIRVATFDAAMFSMAPAVQATAMDPKTAESYTGVRCPRPKGILKAQARLLCPTPSKSRVSIDLQENEMCLGRSGSPRVIRRQAQESEATPRRRWSVEEVLRETGADIIGLQNVRAEEERGMRPLSELAAALGMRYVFAESWAPGYGNAVLSRWPIKRWKAVRVPDISDCRNVLRATIEVPTAGEVNFHCTHLDHLEETWRMKQVESMLCSVDGPHILTGGLNALDATDYSAERWENIAQYYEEMGKPTPKGEVIKYLKGKHFVDAKDFAGEWENVVVVAKGQDVQGTCKYGTRVDYILASPNFPYKFVPGSYTVVSSKGTSDHHIVKVDLMISPASSDYTPSVFPTASGAKSPPLTQSAGITPNTSTCASEVVTSPEETPATNEVELLPTPEVVSPPEETPTTSEVELVPPAEVTPATSKVELVTSNVDPATHRSTPAVDEEMLWADRTAAQEATSAASPSGSTTNPEQITETNMPEVGTDSAVLQTNTLEGDTTAPVPDSTCTEMAPYMGGKDKGTDTVATTSITAPEQPISSSSLDLMGELQSLDELLHRIEQAHKRELYATQLEISKLKEKLEMEQQKSERKITFCKLKTLKAEEAMRNQVRRVVHLEGELQDAKDQIVEGKIKISELGDAITVAQEVHDRVMDQLNKNEADAANYVQLKVEELEALKIRSAKSHRLKDEQLRKLTQANLQLVSMIGLVTSDLFGSESNLLTQPAGIQLMKIREFAPRVKVGVLEVFRTLMPEKELPTSIGEFLRKLSKIPGYITQWKQSAARAGASRALSLAKAHHPNLSIDVISAGKPEKHEDGRPFTAEDYSMVEKPLRGFAARLCSSVNVDKFFHHYQLDGTRTKATHNSGDATARSTSTPAATTPTRVANDPRRF